MIGKKSKAKFTDEFRKKQRATYEKLGLWIPIRDLKPYVLYCRKANWIEQMFNYLTIEELKTLKKIGLFSSNNTNGMVRDHRYSRYSGFKHKVPPVLLRHPANCQLITHKQNLSKAHSKNRYQDNDSISLEQLFSLIKQYKPQWKEQKMCLKAIKKYQRSDTKVMIGGKS